MYIVTRTHGVAYGGTEFNNGTAQTGWKILTGNNVVGVSGVDTYALGSSPAPSKCYIYDSTKTVEIASTTSKSGVTFTFNPIVALTANTVYYILIDNQGSTYYNKSKNSNPPTPSFPYDLTELSITASQDNSSSEVTNEMYALETIRLYKGESIQETGTIGTRVIRKDYPVARGLSAGTTKHLVDKHDYDADTD